MTTIPLGTGNFVRRGVQNVLLHNVILEKDPSNSVDGLARIGRPGIAVTNALGGSGVIRGIFFQWGTFSNDLLVVAGTVLYRVATTGTATAATNIGTIAGAAPVYFAAVGSRVLIATGTTCYSTDGAAVSAVTMPGGESVSSVAAINGYFILVANDIKFFWIEPGGTNPDALDFASAESSADFIVAAKKLFDELYFFGQQTIEVWQPTGDADLPFQRIDGRLYERGVVSRAAISGTDNSIYFVGDDRKVYRCDNQPVRVSDHAVEQALSASGMDAADMVSFTFSFEGHTFYVLRMYPDATYVLDIETGTWGRWSTYGQNYWAIQYGIQKGEVVFACDDAANGKIYVIGAYYTDDGTTLERKVSGFLPWTMTQSMPCGNISIIMDPVSANISLDWSDDGGATFPGPALTIAIEDNGEVSASSLGLIKKPGRMFTVSMTDNALFRLSYMKVNE